MRSPFLILVAALTASTCLADSSGPAALSDLVPRPEPIAARAPGAPLARPFAVDVIDMQPRGVRVATRAPVTVRFDHAVDRDTVTRAFGVEPPAEGRLAWIDDRTFRFAPKRWKPGHDYRVHVGGTAPGGGTVIDATWTFRTEVPEPAHVVPGGGANVVLTFDDGPQYPRQARELLDLLAELGIRALFFPSGRWAQAHPEFVARALRDGHRVCNHTLSHVNLTEPWMTEARIRSEIERGANDGACRLFRPPLMGIDKRVTRVARELGYDVFLWDVDSRDWEGGPAEDIQNLVLGRVKPGSVVLFHMHARATLAVLPSLAARLREAGYVLSWDPADARPTGDPAAAPAVNNVPRLSVQGQWLAAGTAFSGEVPTGSGPNDEALLDSGEPLPGKVRIAGP